MKRAVVFLALIISFVAQGQNSAIGTALITVKDDEEQAIEGATAELRIQNDSMLMHTEVTDKSGTLMFRNLPEGKYFVRITAVNYEPVTLKNVAVFSMHENENAQIVHLHKSMNTLKTVNVGGKRPFIQKLSDRIVVNVENSIGNAGNTAMEVLEKSPGVDIDQNDVISLRGKQGVIIMIDGKPTAMARADLANYLRGLPANAIDRIDIITNPSSKYEAAGNSGIIDIRMKKDQRLGTNGTLNAGAGQGIYPRANAGGTFNYRNKTLNAFGSYNFAARQGLNHLVLNRNFFTNKIFNGSDDKDNYSVQPSTTHTARAGIDFFVSPKSILGFVVNSNFTAIDVHTDNNSVVSNEQHKPSYTFKTNAPSAIHDNNSIANINYKHSFVKGAELTADADYGIYNNNSSSITSTRYFNLDGTSRQPDYILEGNQIGKLTLKTAKADLSQPLQKNARIEAGIKTSVVNSDNDAKFFDLSNGSRKVDEAKTNHFYYTETNNAAYINASKTFKHFDLQVGLRGERTGVSTRQVKNDLRWDSSYFQLFPSAFFNYKVKEDNVVGISVSRRIDRPAYADLNPFLFLIDVSTYGTGNTALLPQITWSYELSYTLKQLNVSLNYSHGKNVIDVAIVPFKSAFPNIPSDPNVTVEIPVNMNTNDYAGLSISYPIQLSKGWNMVNYVNVFYNHYTANLAETQLDKGFTSATFNINNSFMFGRGWSGELNGLYRAKSSNGYMLSQPEWSVSPGVQKNMWDGKGTLKFSVSDIFWTNLPKATITYNNYIENWHALRDSRVANLSFTYRFGNKNVTAARRRTTASEEERQRAGG